MRRTLAFTLGAAATLAIMPEALAQDAAPVEEAAPAATISDAEIQAYANVAVELSKIQADASLSEADKSAQMTAAVQKSGIDPARFNAITEAASKDPQLKQKLQEAVRQ